MKEILITGANGYIGARLSKFLAENGYAVTVVCFPYAPKDESWKKLMKRVLIGDITSKSVLDEITSFDLDTVVHLVSLDHNQCNKLTFEQVMSVNVNPIGNLLEKLSKIPIKKFIYFSTFQVYGNIENNIISEDNSLSPTNIYGLTHLLSENICSYYNANSETNCISIRLSNSFGSPVFIENNCWWLVINELCKDAIKENNIRLKSDGSPLRNFIHSSDLCKAIKILIDSEVKTLPNIYNIASEMTFSIRELAIQVKSIFNNRYNRNIKIHLPNGRSIEEKFSNNNTKKFVIDITKIKNLGFCPSTSLEYGINELFDFLEKYDVK